MLNFLANIRLKMMEDRTSVDGAKFTLDLWLEKRSPKLSSLLNTDVGREDHVNHVFKS